MFYSGYAIYQAQRPLARAEQRESDARLGRYCAALARWRQSLARPARALRREPATYLAAPRACVPVDGNLAAHLQNR